MRRVALLLALITVGLSGCRDDLSGPVPGPAACAWHAQRSHTAEDLDDVSFPDSHHGWVVGGIDRPVIRATRDGGRTWRAQHAGGNNGLSSVAFVDASHGWAVGVHNLLLRTVDGGRTWTPADARVGHDGNLYGIRFADRRHGWIVGSQGVIRATADGGRTWTAQRSGTTDDLRKVAFADRLNGWIVTSESQVLRTVDGGTTWTRSYMSHSDKGEVVADLSFVDARHGWISGSEDKGESNFGLVSKTADGGATWQAQPLATNFDDVRFGAIAFLDARRGWVAGYQGELWYTDSGGQRWGARRSPAQAHRIYQMVFRDRTHGWGVGQFGAIIACTRRAQANPR